MKPEWRMFLDCLSTNGGSPQLAQRLMQEKYPGMYTVEQWCNTRYFYLLFDTSADEMWFKLKWK